MRGAARNVPAARARRRRPGRPRCTGARRTSGTDRSRRRVAGPCSANGRRIAARSAIQGPNSGCTSTPSRLARPSPAHSARCTNDSAGGPSLSNGKTRRAPATELGPAKERWPPATTRRVKASSGSGASAAAGAPSRWRRNASQNAPPPLPITTSRTGVAGPRARPPRRAEPRHRSAAISAVPTRFRPCGARRARSRVEQRPPCLDKLRSS